ncbi:MAG: AsmA-like C-terminal region-containing protein, partial [Chitinophagales bacterium]
IKNNDIAFSNCAFTAGSSDLQFDGTVTNFFPFLFTALGDSNVIHQKIGVNAELASNNLHWEDLMGTNASTTSNDDYSIPSIFYRLSGAVNGSVKQFSYEKFHAEDLHGKILFLPGNIYFNDVGLNAENGSVTANGKLDISRSAKSSLDLAVKLQQLDLTQLFYEFNNFDQSTLTNRNLKGKVTADVSIQSVWDNNKLNLDALHSIADVSVENGELNNFQPMMALGTFVKVNELKDIHFSKMQNQIEIKNRKILIPGMDIFSSALNVHLSGTHDFNNMIDYKVQLNLLRLLTDKFRKSNYDESNTEQTTEGFLNLFLTMTGPASNPEIKYDKQAVKQKIATDLAEEKQNLKDVLKKEFSDEDASQQQAKDWKPTGNLQYFEFENDSTQTNDDSGEKNKSATQENQKKAADNFKSLFQKTPKN